MCVCVCVCLSLYLYLNCFIFTAYKKEFSGFNEHGYTLFHKYDFASRMHYNAYVCICTISHYRKRQHAYDLYQKLSVFSCR